VITKPVAIGARSTGSTGLVRAQVTWVDARGNVLRQDEQWLDPARLHPIVPTGLRGMLTARIRAQGLAPMTMRAMGI